MGSWLAHYFPGLPIIHAKHYRNMTKNFFTSLLKGLIENNIRFLRNITIIFFINRNVLKHFAGSLLEFLCKVFTLHCEFLSIFKKRFLEIVGNLAAHFISFSGFFFFSVNMFLNLILCLETFLHRFYNFKDCEIFKWK